MKNTHNNLRENCYKTGVHFINTDYRCTVEEYFRGLLVSYKDYLATSNDFPRVITPDDWFSSERDIDVEMLLLDEQGNEVKKYDDPCENSLAAYDTDNFNSAYGEYITAGNVAYKEWC